MRICQKPSLYGGIISMKIEIPEEGRVGSLITNSVRESFSHFSSQISESENLMIITRLSPRRLIRHIQLENVDLDG